MQYALGNKEYLTTDIVKCCTVVAPGEVGTISDRFVEKHLWMKFTKKSGEKCTAYHRSHVRLNVVMGRQSICRLMIP